MRILSGWKRIEAAASARLPARLQAWPVPVASGLVVAAVLVIAVMQRTSGGGRAPDAASASLAEAGSLSYPRGPNGARLLSDGPLQLEVTIYETGVPPQFRVYPFDADLKPVSPKDVELRIELHRLGGRVDRIGFRPEADYLQGDAIIEEPHSFDVKVTALMGGRRHEWSYSQIEGKVRLGADQVASAGIVIDTAGPRRMVTTLELPGQVKANETRLAHVVPRLNGVVTEVRKQEGDPVRQGELLAVLSSRELAAAKSAYIAAARHVGFMGVALAREEELWKKKISAERDLLEARRAFQQAELDQKLAAQTLIVLGVSGESLANLASTPAESMARYEIRAPLDGRLIERNVTVGEAVTAEEDIFTVADLSSVWVDIMVYAKDLALVREGQAATVRSTDLGIEVTGRVRYVGPLVGEESRAAVARIVLANPRGQWRPGLFVTVSLVREAAMVPVVVSVDAIQTFRDWQVVFVRYGDYFEARPLELGRSDGQWVEVKKGLSPGERYAALNSFAVKAEIGKLGATHDH
ncbi:MAG: efflux RND transporter periplasmic adaptor subunit [Gemmatimonadaceae bacterium]